MAALIATLDTAGAAPAATQGMDVPLYTWRGGTPEMEQLREQLDEVWERDRKAAGARTRAANLAAKRASK